MKNILLLIFALSFTSFGFAHTECEEEISGLFADSDGNLWINFIDGGSANISNVSENPLKNIMSVALSAKMSDKKVTMRYEANDATCSEIRSDIKGIWIN